MSSLDRGLGLPLMGLRSIGHYFIRQMEIFINVLLHITLNSILKELLPLVRLCM